MLWRFVFVGLICFLLGTGVAMFVGPMVHEEVKGDLPPCPYLDGHDLASLPPGVVTAAGAYEAIRETLARGSLDGVAAQAEVIARSFAGLDPKLASCAKRLAGEQDVESARRALMRLNRLMEKHAQELPSS